MKKIKVILSLFIAFIMLSGFWSGKNEETKKDEERSQRHQIHNETLRYLYDYAPDAKNMIVNSYGYATFANIGVNVLFASFEGGRGLARNNQTGKVTYMNMASGGVGFGMGIKDFRIVFLFENEKVYSDFIKHGWEANAQADAALKAGDDGGAINSAITIAPGVRIYKLTKNGLALQATIQGTKYWMDGDLN